MPTPGCSLLLLALPSLNPLGLPDMAQSLVCCCIIFLVGLIFDIQSHFTGMSRDHLCGQLLTVSRYSRTCSHASALLPPSGLGGCPPSVGQVARSVSPWPPPPCSVGGWCVFLPQVLLAPQPWRGARLSRGRPGTGSVTAEIVAQALQWAPRCARGPELKDCPR